MLPPEPFNMYRRLFHCPCLKFPSCPARVQGGFKKNYTSIYPPICIGYNSVIDFVSPVPLLLCIVLHRVDPDANSSSAVVGRAVRSPPDPERRLPGRHPRTAKGPALPADYQLLRQGQGKTHILWHTRTRLVIIVINPGSSEDAICRRCHLC